MKSKVNRLIKFTQLFVKVVRKSRVRWYSCRKSKHTYRQYQHLVILGLMKYLRTDYRGVIERLECMPGIMAAIGLYQLPHYTTIHKFLQRFSRYRFDRILSHSIDLFNTGNCILAIDGTGYSTSRFSSYYSMRTGKHESRKSIVQSIATVNTANLSIASHHSCNRWGHENTFFKPLVLRASRKLSIRYVVADKAYDSEINHEWVSDVIGARSIIPVRRGWKNGTVIGYHRERLAKRFNNRIYHRRSLVETVFSVIKKRFDSSLQSRSLVQQNKEVGLLCVVYNVYRCVSINCSIIYRCFLHGHGHINTFKLT